MPKKDEPKIEQYPDGGIIVRGPGGKFLPGTRPALQITTSERGRELALRKVELKRERILKGATATLEKTGEWENPTDADVAEALGQAVMEKALDHKDPKQTDAARFILTEGGMAENRQEQSAGTDLRGILSDMAAVARLTLKQIEERETIDGEVING